MSTIVNERPDKINYYLDVAETIAERSTCLITHYGAVIVKNDQIISTGYNGAPRGVLNCTDDPDGCMRKRFNLPFDIVRDTCKAVHSEANAIISASRNDMIGSELFLVGIDAASEKYKENAMPCKMCKRIIINAGIKKVYVRDDKNNYREYNVAAFVYEESCNETVITEIKKKIEIDSLRA